MRNWQFCALLCASAGLGPAGAAAPSEPPSERGAPLRAEIIPLKDIKPGMTGYGVTVFQGTRPDRFSMRVIGVLHRFVPQEDIILCESDDPRLKYSGAVGGMSG